MQGSNVTVVRPNDLSQISLVTSPCPPPFKLHWHAREHSWIKKGQTIATCKHQERPPVRITSPCTGRLAFRKYESNTLITMLDLQEKEIPTAENTAR